MLANDDILHTSDYACYIPDHNLSIVQQAFLQFLLSMVWMMQFVLASMSCLQFFLDLTFPPVYSNEKKKIFV